MHPLTVFAIPSVLVFLYTIYRRFSRISIRRIPGPKPESFLLGNLRQLLQGQAAEADFKWQEQFGDVIRFKAPLGEDRLMISDPKAVQYIFQTSGYNFPKAPDRQEMSRLMSGPGIIFAEGNDHKRHRKVMLPAFGTPESKAFLPLFSKYAAQITEKWKDIIGDTDNRPTVIDIPSWLSRATLDAIGEAAFDYHFGAIDHADNALAKAYFNLLAETLGSPSVLRVFLQDVCQYLPTPFFRFLLRHSPGLFRKAHATEVVATDVSKRLFNEKAEALSQGRGSRDVMSLLVKANASENDRTKLREEEILAQMRTIMLAGHETTANTLTWTLLELSRHPEMQSKLRAEIRATEAAIFARGDTDFSTADFESGMPYAVAVMKEVLRVHPVAYNTHRVAGRDDVLPLSTPITTTTGEVISELPIPARVKIVMSIAGYNRNKTIFGSDAHSFNPERWLDGTVQKTSTSVGVYGNLLTFSAGIRSCIGWRFAVLELQAFLVEIINHFEFALTKEAEVIRRESCGVMVPTIPGEIEKGAQLPLRVSIAA